MYVGRISFEIDFYLASYIYIFFHLSLLPFLIFCILVLKIAFICACHIRICTVSCEKEQVSFGFQSRFNQKFAFDLVEADKRIINWLRSNKIAL